MIFNQFLAHFTQSFSIKIHRLLQLVDGENTSSGALFAVGNLSSSARFIRRSSRNRLRSDSAAICTRFCTHDICQMTAVLNSNMHNRHNSNFGDLSFKAAGPKAWSCKKSL